MSFNKNSIKRIANDLGIARVQTTLIEEVREWEHFALRQLLKRAVIVLHYAERKTIQVTDINLLREFFPKIPHILTVEIPKLRTTQKAFRELVRELLDEIDPDMRCSAECIKVLQYMIENEFIQKLKTNKKFVK